MKKLSFLSAVCVLALFLPNLGLAESGKIKLQNKLSGQVVVKKTRIYTAYNLYADKGKVNAINFQVGTVIPVGTRVKVKVLDGYNMDYSGGSTPRVKFTTLPDGQKYTLKFKQKYHPGKTIYDYANLMFGFETFEELTADMKPDVVEAINRAAVIEGMTKDEVLMSYGHPAEHRTPNMKSNTWMYWKNRFKEKKICFSQEELAITCDRKNNKDL